MKNKKEAPGKVIEVDFDSGTKNNSKECNTSMPLKTNHQYLYNGDPNYTVDPERIEQVLLSVIEKFETTPDKYILTQRETLKTLNRLYGVLKDLRIIGVLPPEQPSPTYIIDGDHDLAKSCDTCRETCRQINRDGCPTYDNVECNSQNNFSYYSEDIKSCKNCEFSLRWVDESAIKKYPDPDILLTCYACTKVQGHSIIDVFDGVRSFSKDLVRLALVEKFGWCPRWKLDASFKIAPHDDDCIDKGTFSKAVENAHQKRMDGYVPDYRYDITSVRTGQFT